MATSPDAHAPAARLSRVLSLVVIALMVAAIAYSGWIALRNWSHIGV